MRPKAFRAYAIIGTAAWSVAALSCHARADEGGRNRLTIAAGAALLPSYDGSDEYRVMPGVLARGELAGFAFFLHGTNLHVDVIRDSGTGEWDWSLGPAIGVRLNRAVELGDAQVEALGELDAAWEIGGWAGVGKTGVFTSAHDKLSFRISWVNDVSGAHESYVITPSVEYALPVSQATLLGLSLSVDYTGKGFGHYYYDVSPAGAQASGLAIYSGANKAGFTKANITLLAATSLSGDLRKGWALFAGAGYGRILGRYADSPIVREAGGRDQWLAGLGAAYTF